MVRRTKPVPVQVIDPFLASNARFKKRLIDFDTASANLEVQHEQWLRQSINIARINSGFHVRLFGFASRLGAVGFNQRLSQRRMNAVLSFLQAIEPKTLSNVEIWEPHGSADSWGSAKDDSPEWRAVEVHLFIGEIPPSPVPPNMTPVQPTVLPLPGGERFKKWSVASPGGVFVAEIVGGGFNIFYIKNEKLNEIRGYIQPVAGIGASLSVSGLGPVWKAIQQIVTGAQASAPDFTSVTPPHPVTWEEMEGCMVRVTGAGAGLVKGASLAVITFSSSGVYQYGPSGIPIQVAEDLFQFTAAGENWQLGAGASFAFGPLIKVY